METKKQEKINKFDLAQDDLSISFSADMVEKLLNRGWNLAGINSLKNSLTYKVKGDFCNEVNTMEAN
jgi:hypothetical protein